MILEKPPLFGSRKEFLIIAGVLLAVIFFRLFLLYNDYREFISKPFYYTDATVLLQYSKSRNGKSYNVLKLQDREGRKFYTTSPSRKNFAGKTVRVKMFPSSSISFIDYLGTFYVKTVVRERGEAPKGQKEWVLDQIASQHSDPGMTAFYQAIFLAAPVPKKLREKISGLGVSHLVALSGFHLTILWGLVYGLMALLYKPLQQRWFPYRFMLLDLGVVTLGILGFYLWFVGFPPSLLRSYVMLAIAWLMLLLGLELLSFEFLAFVVLLLLALFPQLLASLGFWFSVIGVFYIYLVIYWSQKGSSFWASKWTITLFSIPVGIFILMLPVVHGIFGTTSLWQLLTPVLSLLFTPFYPLAIGLHLIGYGGLLDGALLWLFSLPSKYHGHLLPFWVVGIYLLLSVGAIWSRILLVLTFGSALLYFSYLFLFVQ